MARLLGQFLLLSGAKCTTCNNYRYDDGIRLQFAPKIHANDAEFERGGEYMVQDGRACKIVGEMSDDGFLSWLMTQTVPVAMQDGDEREPIPAMQGLGAAMQEAYGCGVSDERLRLTEEFVELEAQYQTALDAKQKELEVLQVRLRAASKSETEAEKTIAALRVELRTYRPDADNTEANPPAPAEPQPEPATAPTNGESDGSGNGTNGQ